MKGKELVEEIPIAAMPSEAEPELMLNEYGIAIDEVTETVIPFVDNLVAPSPDAVLPVTPMDTFEEMEAPV